MLAENKLVPNRSEKKIVSATTITGDEMVELVYKGESLPQDPRFLDEDHGGVFKYFIPGWAVSKKERKYYSVVKEGDIIVGMAELEKSPYQDNLYWITFISVDPKYQGAGYASKVAEEVFRFAKEKNVALLASSYTEQGNLKLKSVLRRLAHDYSVNFKEANERTV